MSFSNTHIETSPKQKAVQFQKTPNKSPVNEHIAKKAILIKAITDQVCSEKYIPLHKKQQVYEVVKHYMISRDQINPQDILAIEQSIESQLKQALPIIDMKTRRSSENEIIKYQTPERYGNPQIKQSKDFTDSNVYSNIMKQEQVADFDQYRHLRRKFKEHNESSFSTIQLNTSGARLNIIDQTDLKTVAESRIIRPHQRHNSSLETTMETDPFLYKYDQHTQNYKDKILSNIVRQHIVNDKLQKLPPPPPFKRPKSKQIEIVLPISKKFEQNNRNMVNRDLQLQIKHSVKVLSPIAVSTQNLNKKLSEQKMHQEILDKKKKRLKFATIHSLQEADTLQERVHQAQMMMEDRHLVIHEHNVRTGAIKPNRYSVQKLV